MPILPRKAQIYTFDATRKFVESRLFEYLTIFKINDILKDEVRGVTLDNLSMSVNIIVIKIVLGKFDC